MSANLLQELRQHITHLIPEGWIVRYYRWNDDDIHGRGNIILFRMSGTGGFADWHIQYPDVSIMLLTNPDGVRSGDALMLSITQFLRSEEGFLSQTVLNYEPLLPVTGPSYLENERARFEMSIRCLVTDH